MAAAAFLCVGTFAQIAPASADDQAVASAPSAATTVAQAAPTPTPAPAPTATPVKDWVVNGFADLSFTTLSGSTLSTIPYRVFDSSNNIPDLQTLNGVLIKNGTWNGKLEINLGSDANVIPSYGQPYNTGFNITQLYAGYTKGPFTAILGKFNTLAGAEYIRSVDDYNFSRSFLFGYAIPFTNTGLRATFAPNSKVSVIAGVNRGWDAVKQTTSGGKSFEGSLALNPTDALAFVATVYTGKEPSSIATNGVNGNRNLLDLVGTYKVNKQLTLVGNYDSAGQVNAFADPTGTFAVGNAAWRGFAGYVNYQLNEKWSGTVRGEVFSDPQGYRTGVPQCFHENTFTLGYFPSSQYILRLEYRADRSSEATFATQQTPRSKQNSLAVEGLVKF
jgi:hypothetical protein